MKKNIYRALFVCALVLSQQIVFAQKQFKNAIAYNDYLASTTDTLYSEG